VLLLNANKFFLYRFNSNIVVIYQIKNLLVDEPLLNILRMQSIQRVPHIMGHRHVDDSHQLLISFREVKHDLARDVDDLNNVVALISIGESLQFFDLEVLGFVHFVFYQALSHRIFALEHVEYVVIQDLQWHLKDVV
tara:strand:- start:65 stop:475 length:411 start_codon:yes stop_codon:yes gene_type:complete